jgi:hypothetical protein
MKFQFDLLTTCHKQTCIISIITLIEKKDYIWDSKYLINAQIQFIEGKYGFVHIYVESHKENENNDFEYQSWLHNIVHQDWFYSYHNLTCIS